jgi:adenine-specific DNA-methyltransferase
MLFISKAEKRVRLKVFRRNAEAVAAFESGRNDVLIRGDSLKFLPNLPDESVDFIFSSPPYCIGKSYETTKSADSFVETHASVIPQLIRLLKPGGSLCWQVGYHVRRGVLVPLDFLVHAEVAKSGQMNLRNRVVWTFNHGLHASRRFSGRHETILWYSKGDSKNFALDSIRVPQLYPGKRHYKGPNKGELSGNPLGKNPGDVWDVPNVKGKHVEKTIHPCQFPVALPQRFIRAICPKSGVVLDPFMGVGTTGVAAALEGKRFVGIEIDSDYASIASHRIAAARIGKLDVRPLDRPVTAPNKKLKVAQKPEHFRG